MTTSILLNCPIIILARVADVSLGTVRTAAVIHGRRWMAWALGFAEVLIWVLVVSKVITTVNQNLWYPIAYAFGFATGNFIGITLEQYFAYGHQVVRIFTRDGGAMATKLREEELGVTLFQGEGRDGPVQMLFIETERRTATEVVGMARELDPQCYYIVDDIRVVSARRSQSSGPAPQEK